MDIFTEIEHAKDREVVYKALKELYETNRKLAERIQRLEKDVTELKKPASASETASASDAS